jgi:hypothetical protein
MRASALLCAAALAFCAPASAQWRQWESDFDEEAKRWSEVEAKIPPYPRPENLVEVEVSAASAHRFYVDAASLSVGEDGVVRYTLVVRAAGGATNVSFEGLRCETRERKLYALGRSDGSWVRARDPRWLPITSGAPSAHHEVLFRDFMCPERLTLRGANEIVEALRRGGR